jgi:hypothetical protein
MDLPWDKLHDDDDDYYRTVKGRMMYEHRRPFLLSPKGMQIKRNLMAQLTQHAVHLQATTSCSGHVGPHSMFDSRNLPLKIIFIWNIITMYRDVTHCHWTQTRFEISFKIHHFIIPTNAHNVRKVELLKHVKIMKAAPKCFGLQSNHHQGATAST